MIRITQLAHVDTGVDEQLNVTTASDNTCKQHTELVKPRAKCDQLVDTPHFHIIAVMQCKNERRRAVGVRRIEVSAVRTKQFEQSDVAVTRRMMTCSTIKFIDLVDCRTGVQQQPHNLVLLLAGGHNNRRRCKFISKEEIFESKISSLE
jgi:hypothetical protein